MSELFWKKLNWAFGVIVIALLLGVVAYAAHIEVRDLDLWLHIGMGKFITQNGYVPVVDVLSNSIAGKPWVNHEWLFQVLVYNLFNRWGAEGLIMMQVVVVVSTMLVLLWTAWDRERQMVMILGLVAVFLVFSQRFTMRPDLFSLLFFALYIFILSLHLRKRWSLWAITVIQVLWANMHGFFFFGPLFILIGILSEGARRYLPLPFEWKQSGKLDDDEYRRLKVIFWFVLAACLMTPGFIHGAVYPIKVFFSLSGESQIFFDYIQELAKPITWANLADLNVYPYYKLLIFVSAVSFILNLRKIDVSALIFWLVFLVFSLKASRNVTYFAFAAYLVIITNFFQMADKTWPVNFVAPRFKHMTLVVLKVCLIIWLLQYAKMLSFRGYYDFDQYARKSEHTGISQRSYADKAVDFLVREKIKGNFFNDFNSGAYLIGRTFPGIKVFIDGRTEAYGADFFKMYRDIWVKGNGELFEKTARQYNLTGVLFNSAMDHIPEKILKYLYQSKEWVLVYFDYDGVVFLKDVPQYQDVIKKHRVDLDNWKPERLDIARLGSSPVKPYRNFYRAFTLQSLEAYDAALAEAQAALDVYPAYAGVHQVVGKIYAKQKHFEEALKHFRLAIVLGSRSRLARANLAQAYLDLGQYDASIKQYKRLLKAWPDDLKARYRLAKIYRLKGDEDTAMKYLQQAVSMDPRATDVMKITEILYEQEISSAAEETYDWAVEHDDGNLDAYRDLANRLKKLGQDEQAEEILNKASGRPQGATPANAE